MSSPLPHIILKAAMSIDGFIDDNSPARRIFSTTEDKNAVTELRKTVDAIFVGAGTVRTDNPSLGADFEHPPLRVTVSSSLNFEPSLKFAQPDSTGVRSIIYSSRGKANSTSQLDPQKIELIPLPTNELQLRDIFADLYTCKGVRTLLIEGGSEVIKQVIEDNLADELRMAISPEILGKNGGARFYTGNFISCYKLEKVHNLNGMCVLHLSRQAEPR